jgi:hypothetical protein
MPVMVLLLGVTGCSSSSSSSNPYAANDASLAALTVGSETLNPAFDTEIVSYAVTVAYGTTTFQVTPTARSPRAYMIQVKQGTGAFRSVASGTPSSDLSAPAVGSSSLVSIRVIAEDQDTTRTYVVRVTQAPAKSSDATLQSLAVSAGSLSPAFAASTTTYADAVPYGTTSFTVTPTVHEIHASLQVKVGSGSFASVASGSPYTVSTVPAVGSTSTVTVRVTAENLTTQDYTIDVSQIAASTDATLAGLSVSGAVLSPSFASLTPDYVATVANGTATFTVTPTVTEGHATVQVKPNGGTYATVASGSPSGPLDAPAVGTPSTVTVHVTAQSGATQDYFITVHQTAALATDNTLFSLVISAGSGLVPTFDAGHLGYTAELPYPAGTFTVTPTVNEGNATVQVQQGSGSFADVASGSPSADLTAPLADGATTTTITIRVTAQNGDPKDYTIDVTRHAPSQIATLDALAITTGALNGAFDSGTLAYTATLPYGATTFTVRPTATDTRSVIQVLQDSVQVGGDVASNSDSSPLAAPALNGTATTITVRVTAEDGVTALDYTIALPAPQEVVALFPLTADTLCTYPLGGDVTGAEAFAPGTTGMSLAATTPYITYGVSTANTWHDLSGTNSTADQLLQRSMISNNSWPASETDIAADRWVEFAVSTSPGKTLNVDGISFYGGSGGGTGLRFKVRYSTDPNFTGAQELGVGDTKMPFNGTWGGSGIVKNDMYQRSWTIASPPAQPTQPIVVSPGATLHVRIYPWLNNTASASSGKYLLLQSFRVHGTVQ